LTSSSSVADTTLWRVAAASVVGVSHQTTGTPCQDAHAVSVLPNGLLVVAVSDGAGSATHSDLGSQSAVRTALASLATLQADAPDSWSDALNDALRASRIALEHLANANTVELRDLACTLILTIASADHLAVAQIGDGAVVVQWADGTLETASKPQHGEHFNETTFLTGPNGVAEGQFVAHPRRVDGIAVLTDGLEHLALTRPEDAPHPPFFSPLFRYCGARTSADATSPELTSFLSSPKVSGRADDDLTLVLATRVP
jgi:serine/threonine protein phosphatase PrpC